MATNRKFLTALVCLCLTGALIFGFIRELGPFLRTSEVDISDNISEVDGVFGLSSYSQKLVMLDCYNRIVNYSNISMLRLAPRNTAIQCRDKAREIVAKAPTDAFAWLVDAISSAWLADNEAFNHALTQAHKAAPNEGWQTILRLEVAESHSDRLTAENVRSEDADIASLASSIGGVKAIAERYVSDPSFRSRVTAVVEKMPPERQATFLRVIKATIRDS